MALIALGDWIMNINPVEHLLPPLAVSTMPQTIKVQNALNYAYSVQEVAIRKFW